MNPTTASDRAGRWTRIAARAAAAVVALVAGAASFEHIASVAIGAGERAWVGYSLPFAIDGLIVVGVTALIEDRRSGRHPRRIARVAVLVGVVATLAANVASADPTPTARLVALAAPISFLLAVEVLTRSGRLLSTPDDTTPAEQQPASAGTGVVDTPRKPAEPRTRTNRATASRRRPTAAQRVVKAVQQTPDASAAQIAARLHVSERTVQRHWPKPATGQEPEPAPGRPAGLDSGNGLAPVPAGAFTRTNRPDGTDRP